MAFLHNCQNCGKGFWTERCDSKFCCLRCGCIFNTNARRAEDHKEEILRLRNELNWGLRRIAGKIGVSKYAIGAFFKRRGIKIERKPGGNVKWNGQGPREYQRQTRLAIWERTKFIDRCQADAFVREQNALRKFDEQHHWKDHLEALRWGRRLKRRKQKENRTNYYLSKLLRSRIYRVLKGQMKSAPTLKLLGCSTDELRIHLQKQFKRGMTWKNYGTAWHIDHKEPCASFDLSKPEEQARCFHFSNLQPLWAAANSEKRARVVPTQRELIFK
jgi:hypothetical protein